MRLPHWLRCHYSRWTTYEYEAHVLGFLYSVRYEPADHDFMEVRQWRECLQCGKRQGRFVKDGPLGPAVPRAASARS